MGIPSLSVVPIHGNAAENSKARGGLDIPPEQSRLGLLPFGSSEHSVVDDGLACVRLFTVCSSLRPYACETVVAQKPTGERLFTLIFRCWSSGLDCGSFAVEFETSICAGGEGVHSMKGRITGKPEVWSGP